MIAPRIELALILSFVLTNSLSMKNICTKYNSVPTQKFFGVKLSPLLP